MALKKTGAKKTVRKLKKIRGAFSATPDNNCGTGILGVRRKTTGAKKKTARRTAKKR